MCCIRLAASLVRSLKPIAPRRLGRAAATAGEAREASLLAALGKAPRMEGVPSMYRAELDLRPFHNTPMPSYTLHHQHATDVYFL